MARFNNVPWLPRWTEPIYSETSVLRKLYHICIQQPHEEYEQILNHAIVPGFYRGVSADAYVYAAKYLAESSATLSITFTKNGSGTPVHRADTKEALLYEKLNPVYFLDAGTLYLKNLDLEAFSTTLTSSYVLNLSSIASAIQEDSLLVVENLYNDRWYIDASSQSFTGTGLSFYQDLGSYLVYYKSLDTRARIVSGLDFISINGLKVSVFDTHIYNIWDEYAMLMSIRRNQYESNSKLKKRCQQLSYISNEAGRISSALHRTTHFYWGTGATLTFSASTWSYVYTPDLTPQLIYAEAPRLISDGRFVVSNVPVPSSIQIWRLGRAIDSTDYILSGSFITPLPSTFVHKDNELYAIYSAQNYSFGYNSSGYIQYLIPHSNINKLVWGFASSGTVITNTTKRIKNWRWNVDLGILSGQAYFDF